jgi:hypothetical protein
MSQRAALVISAALTITVLLIGTGLALRLTGSPADSDIDANADVAQPTADAEDELRQEYIDRLQTSNAVLAASYDRIAALLDDVDQLKAQNTALLEREAVYQQRLAEANARLQEAGRLPVSSIVTMAADEPSAAFAAESGADSPSPMTERPAPPVVVSNASSRLPIVPPQPATVSASPPARVSLTSRASASRPQTAAPTATAVTASRAVPSIFAPVAFAPSEVVAARTSNVAPPVVPPTPVAQVRTQPPPTSQPPSLPGLVAAVQPTSTSPPASLQASAKPSQTHDGDGDSDDRGGNGKDRRNDHRR